MSSTNTQSRYVDYDQYTEQNKKAVHTVKLLADKLVEYRTENDLNKKKVEFLENKLNSKAIQIVGGDECNDFTQLLAKELERGLGELEQDIIENNNKMLEIYIQKYTT